MPGTDFVTIFQTPLHCNTCIKNVDDALKGVSGVKNVDVDLQAQRIAVKGSAPPSAIVKALSNIGKDAIIRGSGKPDSAAVCILESFQSQDLDKPVKGLARIVEVAHDQVVVDLTVNGVKRGIYFPLIRSTGDLSRGPLSTGSILRKLAQFEACEVDKTELKCGHQESAELFAGHSFISANFSVKDLIGRSMVLSTSEDQVNQHDICGVIARSAGAWENEKVVCSCSGKDLWQERQDAVRKGMVS